MKTLKKERALGLLREILTAGGSLVFGAADDVYLSAVGFLVAVASVAWALRYHEGLAVLSSALRKCLSMLPGVLLAFGVISEDRAMSLAGLLTPLFAVVWSFFENGKSTAR